MSPASHCCYHNGELWDICKDAYTHRYVNGHGETEMEATSAIWYLVHQGKRVAHWWTEAEALAWMAGFREAIKLSTPAIDNASKP